MYHLNQIKENGIWQWFYIIGVTRWWLGDKKIMLYEFHSSFLNVKINKNPTLILKAFCYSMKVEFHSSFLNMKIQKKIQHWS